MHPENVSLFQAHFLSERPSETRAQNLIHWKLLDLK